MDVDHLRRNVVLCLDNRFIFVLTGRRVTTLDDVASLYILNRFSRAVGHLDRSICDKTLSATVAHVSDLGGYVCALGQSSNVLGSL